MNRKVTVVGGAGNVGATVARAIAVKELADVVVIDIADQKAGGVALDMFQANPIEGSDSRLIGGGDFADMAGSDVVVITSGVPRKPGMSRDDLLQVNYKIMQSVSEQIVKHAPNAIIVPVANPLDAMCQAVYRLTKFPRERVIGMAGVLDSARIRTFIAMELNVSVDNIHAFVLGGHGDTMVPLPRYSTVAGIPITELLPKEKIDAICARTANGGAEITKLVGTSAWYAPGSAAAEMVEIILKDKKKIVPCSVFLQGEYGISDLFVGVPVKLGARGVEDIIQIKLTAEEEAALKKSAAAVKELTEVIGVEDRDPRRESKQEQGTTDFTDDTDGEQRGREICGICVICGFFSPLENFHSERRERELGSELRRAVPHIQGRVDLDEVQRGQGARVGQHCHHHVRLAIVEAALDGCADTGRDRRIARVQVERHVDAERVAACQLDRALHHLGDAASVDVLHREHVDAGLTHALALAIVEIAKSDDDCALGIHLGPEAANRC